MEHQGGPGFGKTKQILPKLVVQSDELANRLRREPLQEAAQGRFIRQLLQAEQRQKETVVLQLVRSVDALQARDQQEQQEKNQVERIKLRPVGSGPPKSL